MSGCVDIAEKERDKSLRQAALPELQLGSFGGGTKLPRTPANLSDSLAKQPMRDCHLSTLERFVYRMIEISLVRANSAQHTNKPRQAATV